MDLNQGNEPNAALFSDDFKEIFEIDRNYAGLSPEERLRVRESLEVKESLLPNETIRFIMEVMPE